MASLNSNTPMTRNYISLSLNPIYHSMSKNLNNVSLVFTLGSVSIALHLTLKSPIPPSSALGSDHALFLLLPVSMSLAARFPCLLMSKFLDSSLSLNKHVGFLSKCCYYHILALRHIWKSRTDDSDKSIACAIVGSRLDYANAVSIRGWPKMAH